MDQVMVNAAFLSCVLRKDKKTAEAVEKMLNYKPEEREDKWTDIGFKYLAPISSQPQKEVFLNEHPWISTIFDAVYDVQNGVIEQVDKGIRIWKECTEQLPRIDINLLTEAIADYLENDLSPVDKDTFQSLMLPDDDGNYFPINKRGKWNIGIVNPWPGDMSAEAEVLSRMKVGAEDAGVDLTMLSNFGHILDPETQKQTDQFVDPDDLDFVISTHYDTHKSVDAFYYHTLWNPPEIPLNLDGYTDHVTDNYLMNDDYLIYDDGGMSEHLRCILMNNERNLDGVSSLTASFPKKSMLKPNLDDPKMFYCGMNWERVVHHTNRHEGLFKLLDETGKVKFFGPEKVEAWGGVRPWDGYKCYQYSIPFDGFSILKEINDCGICLVLSSDIHRRAGAATNRTYEACAAGAVIISDDNPFMLKHFGDAALFIQYNKNDPEDTFKQLMEKYQWVVDHKEEALKLARKAQEIFEEKFAVDHQINRIVKRHADCLSRVKESLFAEDEDEPVLATFVTNTQKVDEALELISPVLENIKRQYYRSIQPVIAVDDSISKEVETFCKKILYSTRVIGMPLFDFKGSRRMTDAEALDNVYESVPHRYFINIRGEEVWFRDHITTLVRCIKDNNVLFAYSGRLFEDKMGYRRTDMFRTLSFSTIYYMNCPDWMPVPGQILFSADCHSAMPKCMSRFVDGTEHYALMNLLIIKGHQNGYFSRRMSFDYKDGKFDERNSVMPSAMQIRLIRDSVKYSLNDAAAGTIGMSGTMDSSEVMRVLAWMPFRLWFKSRMNRCLLRVLPSHGRLYRRVEAKYRLQMEEQMRFRI